VIEKVRELVFEQVRL